jgi:hypothetical protein
MPDLIKELIAEEIKTKLHNKGLKHLDVRARGEHIVVFSEYEGKKENRCRFTEYRGKYLLGMADHNNKWEATPFEGTINELLELVVEQFGWVLTDYGID